MACSKYTIFRIGNRYKIETFVPKKIQVGTWYGAISASLHVLMTLACAFEYVEDLRLLFC